MTYSHLDPAMHNRAAWNAGKTVGTTRPLTQKQNAVVDWNGVESERLARYNRPTVERALMGRFLGLAAASIALLMGLLFLVSGLVAPFGSGAEVSGPAFVLSGSFLGLSIATLAQLMSRDGRTAMFGVLIGSLCSVISIYLYAARSMLFSWASVQVLVVIGCITAWHIARLRAAHSPST